MNKQVSLLLPGEQMTAFILNDKIGALKIKLEFQKMFICYHELQSISILKGFLVRLMVYELINVFFDIAVSSFGLFT